MHRHKNLDISGYLMKHVISKGYIWMQYIIYYAVRLEQCGLLLMDIQCLLNTFCNISFSFNTSFHLEGDAFVLHEINNLH